MWEDNTVNFISEIDCLLPYFYLLSFILTAYKFFNLGYKNHWIFLTRDNFKLQDTWAIKTSGRVCYWLPPAKSHVLLFLLAEWLLRLEFLSLCCPLLKCFKAASTVTFRIFGTISHNALAFWQPTFHSRWQSVSR